MSIVRETFATTPNRIGWSSAAHRTVKVACSACHSVRDAPSDSLSRAGFCQICIDGSRFGDTV
jgi:hypothetical protein